MSSHTTKGRRIDPLIPGSEKWLRSMSASKVPAVLGLSPYDSPFSLWHRMAGEYEAPEQTDAHARGHYLEPAIAAWWNDKHSGELFSHPGLCWAHAEHDWYTASPDRLVGSGDDMVAAVLECKTAADADGWGKPGTDEVPPGYRAQVVTQMDVVGVEVAYVAVLLPFLNFAEYVIHYDKDEADYIRQTCADFMATLKAGTPPPIDGHSETYETVRALHPDIERDETCELPVDIATRYEDTWSALNDATYAHNAARAVVLDLMGNARKATHNGRTLATRQAKGNGLPFLKTSLKETAA